jgi:K(+)-stimulated pyrophosphate-energized sodium pump
MAALNTFEQALLFGVLAVALISLVYAYWLWRDTIRRYKGSAAMQTVWQAIKTGANAYLSRQLRTILPILVGLAVVLFFSVYVVKPSAAALEIYGSEQAAQLVIGIGRMLAFVAGASFSIIVGQLGMRVAVEGNIRVAAEADRGSYNGALTVAYRAGTFTGMLTDGLGLLGGTTIFMIFGTAAPDVLLGFGFGGTLVALFMRIGGGIYTKSADVGADLVGKVEQGLPEDDPRNAAVVADLVGDNVGDCAGMAADIFESYEVTIVSALILGLFLMAITGNTIWIIYPLVVRAIGVLSSIIGTFAVPIWASFPLKFLRAKDAEAAMFRSYELSSIITVVLAFAFSYILSHASPDLQSGDAASWWWKLSALNMVGIILAVVFNPLTSYFTSHKYRPVMEIAESTQTGSATTILSGLAVGMESSVWSVVVIVLALAASYVIFGAQGLIFMLYGVAMIGIGMLSQTGNNVAMDTYGPIADNANGIGEMAHLGPEAYRIMADLDAVGNTTKAITKQIAIASAVVAATALFFSFVADALTLENPGASITELLGIGIPVSTLNGSIGFLLGGALPFLFAAFCLRAVARGANMVVAEVRRQFKIPGVIEGTRTPDYARVVSITTATAQKELLSLVAICVGVPLLVGMVFDVKALGTFLAGVIVSGQLLAVFMAVSGGALDNAKKYVEDGHYGGKGSPAHKAGVEGDTVGDPLKDTAGPALNPMIKVVNLVSLLAAPLIVEAKGTIGIWIAAAVLFVLVVWGIWQSKREVSLERAPA